MPRGLAAFNRSSHLNGTAKKKEFFGKCRLTSVRVGNDGEGAAFFHVSH